MVFNSLIFIFCFLPISVLLYRFLPSQFLKNIVLFVLSLLFYAWNEPYYVLLLLLSIAWNYISGLQLMQEEDLMDMRETTEEETAGNYPV